MITTLPKQYSSFLAYRLGGIIIDDQPIAYWISYADNVSYIPEMASQWAQSVQFNLLWSPLPQTTLGLEYTYASKELENNESGNFHRIQFSSVFSF